MKIDELRRATTIDHKRVETAFPLMSPQADRSTYIQYLKAFHGFIAAWEEELLRMAPEGLRDLISGRRRLAMVEADLAWHGVTPDSSQQLAMPSLNTKARLLGAMYVMEGSALGGQIIARHLERMLNLEPGHGNAYFRGFGERTGVMWREFCGVLERNIAEDECEDAISGARDMFAVFELWMLHLQVRSELSV
jgi:heme oxygenase